MRRISAAFSVVLLVFLTMAPVTSAPVGFSHFMPLRVDSSQLSTGSDLTDYPVSVSVTNDALKTAANGGHVTSANGYDICFYADYARTTALSWTLVSYDGSAGTVKSRIKLPSVSHTLDTVFWMFFGDAGRTTFQSTATDTWDTDFVAVYQRPGLDNDATTNGNNPNYNTGTATTGLFAGATAYNGSQYSAVPTATSLEPQQFSLEAWAYYSVAGGSQQSQGRIIAKDQRSTAPWITYILQVNDATSGHNSVAGGNTGSAIHLAIGTHTPAISTWHHVAGTYDGSTYRLYLDGVQENASNYTDALAYTHDVLGIAGPGAFFTGALEDVRISRVARPAGWILAESKGAGLVKPGLVGMVGYSAIADPQTRYNDQYPSRYSDGDTTRITTSSTGARYLTLNDPYGFNGCGIAWGIFVGSFSGAGYTNGQCVNTMSSFSELWKNSGLLSVTDAYRTDLLYLFAHKQLGGPPWTADHPTLMKSLDGGATWCNPAHSTGIMTCSITPRADGDAPSDSDTPTMGSWTKLIRNGFVVYEAGATGAIAFDGNDQYFYVYGNDNLGVFHLARCSRSSDCTQSGIWQAYVGAVGGDPAASGNWSSSDTSATSMNAGSDAQMLSPPVYVGGPFGYLMAQTNSDTDWGTYILRSPSITGPWTVLGYIAGDMTTRPNFPFLDLGSLSRGSTLTITMLNTGDYTIRTGDPTTNNYSLFWRTLTLFGPRVRHR